MNWIQFTAFFIVVFTTIMKKIDLAFFSTLSYDVSLS